MAVNLKSLNKHFGFSELLDIHNADPCKSRKQQCHDAAYQAGKTGSAVNRGPLLPVSGGRKFRTIFERIIRQKSNFRLDCRQYFMDGAVAFKLFLAGYFRNGPFQPVRTG